MAQANHIALAPQPELRSGFPPMRAQARPRYGRLPMI